MFCVGTMQSATGWETKSVENAMNLHFYYWFVTRESQSRCLSKVPSFYALWKRFGEKQEDMISNTNQLLGLYMKEQWPDTTITVTTENIGNTESLYRLLIDCKVKYAGVTYSLSKAVAIRPDNFELLDKHRLGS